MNDREYCAQALREVSRTFSQPIELLRDDLRVPVTCAYLLCRIADTVEDHAALSADQRDDLYDALLAALLGRGPASAFEERYRPFAGEGADHRLALSFGRVLAVFGALPERTRTICVPWIAEMIRGMSLYGHRPAGADGLVVLHTLSDLERYCYFVAGTVGHLLTDLFVDALPGLQPERRSDLERYAEEFGVGLQLVNVLKDITDDRVRRISYVPRQLCRDAGIDVAQLTDLSRRGEAHRALGPIFDRARFALEAAFEYALAVPAESTDIRLFCLLPLWIAARTLTLARENDAQLTAGAAVKISREEVFAIIDDCHLRCGDDQALREGWENVTTPGPWRPAPAETEDAVHAPL
jgi:farnesyl-diphosphate farnesyltransferase